MISITRYISEGFVKDFNKAIDNNILSKSRLGRAFMRSENRFDERIKDETRRLKEAARQRVNAVLNTKDGMLGRNFKIRK